MRISGNFNVFSAALHDLWFRDFFDHLKTLLKNANSAIRRTRIERWKSTMIFVSLYSC